MMKGRAPTIMVSSTFFDLREIRTQLAKAIEVDLAYRALISESSSFPIEPDLDTIENCRRRVEQDADILVLIIAARYGSVDLQSGKSVTNLEYAAAKAKGIPIYVFIERRSLTLFEAWLAASAEQQGALGSLVDDVRVFEFIKRIRVIDKVWTNGFDNADDIIMSLRLQLAYMMMTGLSLQNELKRNPNQQLLRSLSPHAFRIAVDEPRAWEFFLFAEVLHDEMESYKVQRRQYDLNLAFGPIRTVDEGEILGWVAERLHHFARIANAATTLIQTALTEALGPPGQPGNIADIVFVARQLGEVYRMVIEWTQEVRRAEVDEEFEAAVLDLATISTDMIEKLGNWGATLRHNMQREIMRETDSPSPSDTLRAVKFMLEIDVFEPGRIVQAFKDGFLKRGVEFDDEGNAHRITTR